MKKNTIYEIVLMVLSYTLTILGVVSWKTNVLLSVFLFLLTAICLIIFVVYLRKIKVWPFNKKIDFRYKTIKKLIYSGIYISTSFKTNIYLEYDITLNVIDRDDFIAHELLDDKNKDKYLKNIFNVTIYSSIAGYQILCEKDGYPHFHKILDIDSKKITIAENPEHLNNIISKIENAINGITACGIKCTNFNFKRARKYSTKKYSQN